MTLAHLNHQPTVDGRIVIAREDPRGPEARRLIGELDAYMAALYPAKSNHLLDADTLAGPALRFFVARLSGNAVGCGALWLQAGYGEVKRVYVRPAARRHGVARLMLERLEAEARGAGLSLMRLETGIHQPQALGLFAAHGFAVSAPFGDYPADDPNSVFMEKRLG